MAVTSDMLTPRCVLESLGALDTIQIPGILTLYALCALSSLCNLSTLGTLGAIFVTPERLAEISDASVWDRHFPHSPLIVSQFLCLAQLPLL